MDLTGCGQGTVAEGEPPSADAPPSARPFGQADEEGAKLQFPEGLPAFESHREFACRPDSDFPGFLWLRSLSDDEPLRLLAVSPFSVVAGYAPEIRDSDAEKMGIETPGDAVLLSILNFSGYPEEVAANLAGPILVNRKTMQARQVILENASEYEVHHRLELAAHE